MNADRAIAFIQQHGDDIEQARLDYLLHGCPAPSTIQESLFSGQREDGGWSSFWAPDYTSLDATCFRLAQAEQLGALDSPEVAAAAAFVVRRQRPDGMWEEDQSVSDRTPPWLTLGDLAASLYLTANCGYWLSMLDRGDEAQRAADALSEHIKLDGSLPSFPHTHWLVAGLWWRTGCRNEAERTIAFLAAARIPSLPTSNLAWLYLTLALSGVSPQHPVLREAMKRLMELQEPDGRWRSEDGPERDVHATIEALRVSLSLRGTTETGA